MIPDVCVVISEFTVILTQIMQIICLYSEHYIPAAFL